MFRLSKRHKLSLSGLLLGIVLWLGAPGPPARAQSGQGETSAIASPARTPIETVRAFYQALHQRRFREAFAISIYKPAVEGLSDAEMTELRPDFEKVAAAIPENFLVTGESITNDEATVFIKLHEDEKAPIEPVFLTKTSAGWIVGGKQDQGVVKKSGKNFFFNARIETHHAEVEGMLQRIAAVQSAYASQHQGKFGDLAALIKAGYVPKDIEGPETTGYRFQIVLGADARSYTVTAVPAVYGRTGKLSYFMNQSGQVQSKDVKGKPLKG